MTHQKKGVLLTLCILASSAALAQAPSDPCKWSDRGDRWEGVLDRQPVSGGSFELLSVHYQRPPEAASESDQLHLLFWLPEREELDEIEVWQPARLYRMEPARKQYGEGRQGFTWSRGEVIDRLGLTTDSLYTRIKAGEVFYPALLSARGERAPVGGYAFVFQSGAGIDATCTITRQGEAAQVVRSFDCYEDYGGTIVIEWDGRDERGQAVPAGLCTLKIEGEMLARTFRPLRQSVSFWHRAAVD